MSTTEELSYILKKEQEAQLIPFLQKLDKKQRTDLVPEIKELYKYYSEFSNFGGGSSYSTRWTMPQQRMLGVVAFVCYNQKDFEQTSLGRTLTKEALEKILPWHCPDWFAKYINSHADDPFIPFHFDYEWYIFLTDGAYIKPNKTLAARGLSNLIVKREHVNKSWEWIYQPEKLLIHDITLKEHIWYLFEVESSVHSVDRYAYFDDKENGGKWMLTFKDFVQKGLIDRKRILLESITASNKGFSQTLSNWFIDLFSGLQPTPAELLELQGELLNTFNSNFSKIPNAAIKYLKDIATDDAFDVDGFLDHAPLLMSSEYKTAVTSVLMILDKLAKKYPERREQICLLTSEALIQQDNGLQVRAAKLLQKYGDTGSDAIKEAVATYRDNLLLEAKGLIAEFWDEDTIDSPSDEEEHLITDAIELAEISFPETFDEFVFLASQAFDQNEPYHFDLLPAAILRYQGEMTAANIQKLAPAFQRAYKLIVSDFTSTRGYLDNMLAKFFIDYGKLLVSFHPAEAAPIKQMHDSFVNSNNSQFQARLSSGIKPWSVYSKSTGYKPHKHLLLNAIFLLERKINLPLLSTPTHAPCWVSPLALVERLIRYQEAKVIPADMDFMVAVARCLKGHDEAAIKLANEKLNLDYRRILSYLFGGKQDPQSILKLKPVWLVMALTREPAELDSGWFNLSDMTESHLRANFKWESKTEPYTYKEWDYTQRKYIDAQGNRKVISIQFGEKHKQLSSIKKILGKFMPSQKPNELSIYDDILLKYEHISAEHNDIKRLLHLNPHKPELLVAHIINKALSSPDFSSENDKKMITYTLETLMELNANYGLMAHLLVASCMICNDKSIRIYAAELWLSAVADNKIDSAKLGEIIGIHEQIELAPLKRFTDLVLTNMFGISARHNKALQSLLDTCILNMADKPISNTKKLLEIYAEVLAINKSSIVNQAIVKRLTAWQTTDALAKPVQKIKEIARV